MTDISIQSDKFVALYQNLQPTLIRLIRDRSGPQRVVATEMEAFFPSSVEEVLNAICQSAEAAIALFGPGVSQVVLDTNEVRMVQWVLSKTHKDGA